MSANNMTRRRFITSSIGGAATIAACGIAADAAMDSMQAFADVEVRDPNGIGQIKPTDQIYTLCQGCLAQCGCVSFNVESGFSKIMPDFNNEVASGGLCARGYGFTQSAFSESNISHPLKRLPSGRFDELSWDKALGEIAEAIEGITLNSGAGALAMVYAPNATTDFYAPYLMSSLGSANVFVDDAIFNAPKAAGFNQAIGACSYTPDFARAKVVLLVDTSYADIEIPGLVSSLQQAKEGGARIISVDSRYATIGAMSDQWISVRPGTELALLLAVCRLVIDKGEYDKAYIAENTTGFADWVQALNPYTAEWAAGICGVTSTEIEELAATLVGGAPNVAIEYGNASIATGAFANTGETARTICLLNTLLATWNQNGGAYLPFDWAAFEASAALPLRMDSASALASVFDPDAFPLADSNAGSMALVIERIKTHDIKGLFAVDANIAQDYASSEFADALSDLELLVAVSREMNETCELADYVLPECSYLECSSLPYLNNGISAQVSLQSKAIHKTDSDARPIDWILTAIGRACGSMGELEMPIEDIAAAQLALFNLDAQALQTGGTATVDNIVSRVTGWNTPTAKIQFSSQACADAGYSACPIWVEPYEFSIEEINVIEPYPQESENPTHSGSGAQSAEGGVRLRLITGEETVFGPTSNNIERLSDLAKKYELYSAWINPATADILGVRTGDEIVVTSANASDVIPAKVTECINPGAIYLPRFYGSKAKGLENAQGIGINPMVFVDAAPMLGYGSVCNQGCLVTVQKSGA